jgi:hypothetical protein
LDFVPPDLEFVPPGLDFVPADLDFVHRGGAGVSTLPGRACADPIQIIDIPARPA